MSKRLVNILLVTDQQKSILAHIDTCCSVQHFAYSPYGYDFARTSTLGFNGSRREPATGHYVLGNGYRALNSRLMRFNSPDSLSPFAIGGLSSYAYCLGDPVNCHDPSGHVTRLIMDGVRKLFSRNPASTLRLPSGGKVQADPVATLGRPGKVPDSHVFIGYHGSEVMYKHSLESGLNPNFSFREAQGAGFYIATRFEHANEYAAAINRSGGKRHVYGVFADIRNWTYGRQYKKDTLGVPVIKKEGFADVVVRFDFPKESAPEILRSDQS